MRTAPPAIDSIVRAAGRTPLVRLERLERPGGARLFAKCEYLGPGGSIFDRAAVAALCSGDRAGHLEGDKHLFCAGGSDASISLALVAAALGQPLSVVVPKSLHPERKRALADYGATLIPVDDGLGFEKAEQHAFDLAREVRGAYVSVFEGCDVGIGYAHIGAEIIEALGQAPALTVCGLDLGAIPTGIACGLSGGKVVAVEPDLARIGSGGAFAPHLLGGLAPGPEAVSLDRKLVSDFEAVSERDAWEMAERLAREAGLLVGIASGAVMVAALRRAAGLGAGQDVVCVLPDSGERRFLLADFFT